MKHYFYFKKGQPVPKWILWWFDSKANYSKQAGTFKTNGKVMVDVVTGEVIIWPSDKRCKSIIFVQAIHGVEYSLQTAKIIAFKYSPRQTKHTFSLRIGDKRTSPLTGARRAGYDIRTTTKCLPIPEHFERRKGGAA